MNTAEKRTDMMNDVETEKATDVMNIETEKTTDKVNDVETEKTADKVNDVETEKTTDKVNDVETEKTTDQVNDVETEKTRDTMNLEKEKTDKLNADTEKTTGVMNVETEKTTEKLNADTEKTTDKVNANTEKTTNTAKDKTETETTTKRSEGKERRGGKKGKNRKARRKSEETIPDDGVPYDTGWAWMIVLAGFINLVIASGYNRSTFIFFVNFLEEFRAPVTETALLFGVKSGVNSIVGLFIMNAVVGRFGVRKTVLVGAVCLSLSAILGSLANDVTSLILSQAVFHGLGMSMLGMPITVLLGFYFRRRRSLANSISKCGVGVGAVAFPPIVTYFLDQYGLRGSLLLMGGVCLNSIAAAFLLRPTSFYKKRRLARLGHRSEKLLKPLEGSGGGGGGGGDLGEQSSQETPEKDRNAGVGLMNGTHGAEQTWKQGIPQRHETKSRQKTTACTGATDRGSAGVAADKRPQLINGSPYDHVIIIQEEVTPVSYRQNGQERTLLPPGGGEVTALAKSTPELYHTRTAWTRRPRTLSENEAVHPYDKSSTGSIDLALDVVSQSRLVKYLSMPDLDADDRLVLPPADLQGGHSKDDLAQPKRTCLTATWQLLKRIFGVLDFSLFYSPMFRLLVAFFICAPMVGSVSTYLPAMSKERGLNENQRAILLSVIGGLDFCCRLFYGFVADLKILKVSTIIGIAFTLMGVVCQLIPLLTTFPLLIGLAVAQGMLSGVAACLTPILIMEDIGLENTAKALGFNKLFSGAAMAAFHPLLGYIRDTTGSYDVAYHVIGAFTLVSAALIFCLRFLPHRLPPDKEEKTALEMEELSPLTHEPEEMKGEKHSS